MDDDALSMLRHQVLHAESTDALLRATTRALAAMLEELQSLQERVAALEGRFDA